MRTCEREITKEIYEKAAANNGIIPESAYSDIFSEAEVIGYGVYFARAFCVGGKYLVQYQLGDSCD